MFWSSNKDEKTQAEFDENFSNFIETLEDRAWLYKVLTACLTALAAGWIFALLCSNIFNLIIKILGGYTSKPAFLFLGVFFIIGIVFAYSVFRLKFPDVETNKLLNADLMASINYQEQSNKRWFIWIFSILFGLINVLLLVFTSIFLEDKQLYLFDL